jgi:hypothetical protein
MSGWDEFEEFRSIDTDMGCGANDSVLGLVRKPALQHHRGNADARRQFADILITSLFLTISSREYA